MRAENEGTRVAAVDYLCPSRIPHSLTSSSVALDDADHEVRKKAARALSKIDPKRHGQPPAAP
jgi:hypothetical protein